MKMFKIASILIFALLFVQPIFAQNSGRKVVAIHIDNKDNMSNQQDLLRDVNAYLHKVFEQNGYALASVELEDREWANMLEKQNFIDANVRGKNGEPIDYIFSISLEYYANDYKFYSKRIGTINTDYRQGVPIVKNRKIIDEQDIRYLIALEIVDNYDKLSATNQTLLVNFRYRERELIRRSELPPAPIKREPILKPNKNNFDIYVYSGFNNETAFGFGIGYNISYFQMNLDGGFGSASAIHSSALGHGDFVKKSDLGKVYHISNNVYSQAKGQFVVTPGINLKYFKLGLGVGTMITRELSVEKSTETRVVVVVKPGNNSDGSESNYLYGTTTSKGKFLLRPTLSIAIPFNKDWTGRGLWVTLGYNIIPNTKDIDTNKNMSHFVAGINLSL